MKALEYHVMLILRLESLVCIFISEVSRLQNITLASLSSFQMAFVPTAGLAPVTPGAPSAPGLPWRPGAAGTTAPPPAASAASAALAALAVLQRRRVARRAEGASSVATEEEDVYYRTATWKRLGVLMIGFLRWFLNLTCNKVRKTMRGDYSQIFLKHVAI